MGGGDSNESNLYIKVIIGIWCVALGDTPASLLWGAVGVRGRASSCWHNCEEYVQETPLVCCRHSDGGERVKSYEGKNEGKTRETSLI